MARSSSDPSLCYDEQAQVISAAIIYDHDQFPQFVAFELSVVAGDRDWRILRRFSDFEKLHRQLSYLLNSEDSAYVQLPRKRIIKTDKFDPEYIEIRRKELDAYIQAILRHPRLKTSDVVKRFLDENWGKSGPKTKLKRVADVTVRKSGFDRMLAFIDSFSDSPSASPSTTTSSVSQSYRQRPSASSTGFDPYRQAPPSPPHHSTNRTISATVTSSNTSSSSSTPRISPQLVLPTTAFTGGTGGTVATPPTFDQVHRRVSEPNISSGVISQAGLEKPLYYRVAVLRRGYDFERPRRKLGTSASNIERGSLVLLKLRHQPSPIPDVMLPSTPPVDADETRARMFLRDYSRHRFGRSNAKSPAKSAPTSRSTSPTNE